MSGVNSTYSTDKASLYERVNYIEKTVAKTSPLIEEIYKSIVGNETFQQEGLLTRVKKLKEFKEKNIAVKNKLIGAFIVGGAVWTVIW